MTKIFSYLLWAAVEAALVAAFICLGAAIPTDVLVLDIIVSSLVLALWMLTFTSTPVDLDDPAAVKAGGLGIDWSGKLFYSIAAVLVIISGIASESMTFTLQLLIQIFLALALGGWMLASFMARDRVADTHRAEAQKSAGITAMRSALRSLDYASAPKEVRSAIESMTETLRYTSPLFTAEAADIEQEFIALCGDLRRAMTNYDLNSSAITAGVDRALSLARLRSRCMA